MFAVWLGVYVLIGLIVSLRADYLFGDREHAVNTMIDIVLWPVMVLFWIRYWGK